MRTRLPVGFGARPLILMLVAASLVLGAWGTPRLGWGQAQGAARGAGRDELLNRPAFDRITLVDGSVLLVEPVAPRPLPPYDAKKERERERRRREKNRPTAEGNIALPGQKSKSAPAEEAPPTRVTIHLLEGEMRDFQAKRSDIKNIEYFEDMLLAEAERLTRARQFDRAFEHLLAVRQRDPRWRGLDEQVNRLLFEEGRSALRDNDTDRGLRLLGELHTRKPDYPGLDDELGAAYGGRIAGAFEVGAYARGRQILHELERLAPQHAAYRESRALFVDRAQALWERARKESGGERLDDLIEALRTWPKLEAAAEAYRTAFAELPTLDVAVVDLPDAVGPWVRSPSTERIARLLYLPILAEPTEAATRGNRPGQLAAALDAGELGKRLELRLRPGILWSDGSRPVSTMDVIRALSDRADPRSPAYSARWADTLAKVVATDEAKVEVHLTRTILKPENWLLGPLGPAHAAWDGWVTTARGRQPVGDGPYGWQSASKSMAHYVARPRGGSEAGPKVLRIREMRYPSASAAVSALIRGDVSLVEHVPPDRVAGLARGEGLRVGRYEQPRLHRIAVDGRNPVLRNRTLRRGLSYAIDRKAFLEENLLKRAADEVNAVADGPFPKGSYADAPGVKPLGYDPLLAKMLVAAARKEMDGAPIKLTFEYPALPEAQAVAPKIAAAWRVVGVEVEAIERPESELEEELRSGKRFDLAYRATRCAEPVWEAGPLLCPGYDAPPSADGLGAVASPRILELLLQLEHAPELPTATGLAVMIDRESRDELPILPLWQLEDHYAWRTRLSGPGESAAQLYQGIEAWEIEPWFAQDPW